MSLGNGDNGVEVFDASDNLIGGTTVGARNVISANRFGVLITGNSAGNLVQGNFVGTDATGDAALAGC